MSADRKRSVSGVTSEGAVMARRGLFWGEKIVREDEETSKSYQVIPIPEGWRIEVDDQSIVEGLMRQESKKSLDQRFVKKFTQALRNGFAQIIRYEKFSSKKDEHFQEKAAWSIGLGLWPSLAQIVLPTGQFGIYEITMVFGAPFFLWTGKNICDKVFETAGGGRKVSNPVDILMPSVEVDRAVRGLLYLNLKGRNLVRLSKSQQS